VLIKWKGPRTTRRVVDSHVWGPENDWTCEVQDHETQRLLLAGPEPFENVTDTAGAEAPAESETEKEEMR